jgi:hypothetical protein
MKFLHIVLILLTILSVFSRRHHRSRTSQFSGIKNFFSSMYDTIFKKNEQLIPNIVKLINENITDCTVYKSLITGNTIRKLFQNSRLPDSCQLNCEGWSDNTPFNLFVDYAKQGTSDKDKVDRLITAFGEKTWAFTNCTPSSGRRKRKLFRY